MQKAGVKNFEMEGATLMTLANLFARRAGMISVIVANRVTDEFEINDDMQKRAGHVASLAVTILAGWDAAKVKAGKNFLYPNILK